MVQSHPHHKRRPRRCGAFTLTEVLISVFIVMVLATGAMGYQYNSTRDVRLSEVQATAARLGLLLLESWKGRLGSTGFDPVDAFDSEMTLRVSTTGPEVPRNTDGMPLTRLGSYEIELKDVCYYVTLSYEEATASEPMLLNTVLAWRRDYGQGQLDGSEYTLQYSAFFVSY